MKAAIYSRFSTDRQNESSITDQVRVCTEFAEREGMTIVETFEDQGISGAAFGNRPAFLRMRAAAQSREFDALLVMDTTRLARSQELAPLIDRLRFHGLRVIGVQDGFDSTAGTADMQAGLSGILSVEFRRMVKVRTHSALESLAKQRKPTGGKCYGYANDGEIIESEADIVRGIFARYIEGTSSRTIAKELNARGVPSPGSKWNRTTRRCSGWVGSGVRAILQNERYAGRVIWNRSEWRKDPDTGKRIRVERPRSEWIVYNGPAIIDDETFAAAAARFRDTSNNDARLKTGGKPVYLLSGLLRCGECGAAYVVNSATSYACGSYIGGHCDNGIRVRRDHAEDAILRPVWDELLAPARVAQMAEEMRREFARRLRKQAAAADAVPAELQALDERIGRLRERLAAGDPDLEPDEIQAGIDRAGQKRRELMAEQPAAKESAKLLVALPRAAEAYRRQIKQGLKNDPRAAGKARALLRRLLGTVRLVPEETGLWAEFEMQPGVLLRAASSGGSGGRI